MTARLFIGDVHDRMRELEDGSYDLIITSPPFLALRSYLPDGHPLKDKEIGSEATPAAFLDVMLALTAEWGRLLAPHGSIAVEIGDTYSGSGGAGGDYYFDGLRAGQTRFDGSATRERKTGKYTNDKYAGRNAIPGERHSGIPTNGPGWPLAKSLAMIPELYAASLAYGRNLLTGEDSPAGRWRVRNFKPWIRSNPPVGALGDKERPATSYVTVATRSTARYFDLDAVRTAALPHSAKYNGGARPDPYVAAGEDVLAKRPGGSDNAAGAPPLDWNVDADAVIDAVIDAELDRRAKIDNRAGQDPTTRAAGVFHAGEEGTRKQRSTLGSTSPAGARGVHIRRALVNAGILPPLDALDVSPKGYAGAHYAVWPAELVLKLVQEMCPRRVCTTCGQPSRRIVDVEYVPGPNYTGDGRRKPHHAGDTENKVSMGIDASVVRTTTTTGWSDCGCSSTDPSRSSRWRPGRILDPFGGSGTTAAVATGLGVDCDLIDIDERNADLATERVGMFLEIVDCGTPAPPNTTPTP